MGGIGGTSGVKGVGGMKLNFCVKLNCLISNTGLESVYLF